MVGTMNAHPTFTGDDEANAALAARLRSLALPPAESRPEPRVGRRRVVALLLLTAGAAGAFGVVRLAPPDTMDRLSSRLTSLVSDATGALAPAAPGPAPAPVATTAPPSSPAAPLALPEPAGIVGTGRVVALRSVGLSPERSGLVARVAVETGDTVSAGDLLLALDDTDARLAERGADLALLEARAALRLAELDEVGAGDVLERARTLLARNAGSRVAVEDAERAFATAGERTALARAGVARAELALERAQRDVARHAVRAPFAGIVVARAVDPGEHALAAEDSGPGESIAIEVMDPASRVIDVDIAQASIGRIAVGSAGTATLDAYPGHELAVRVASVAPSASLEKGTVTVRVEILEDFAPALPNMSARVRLRAAPDAATTAAVETRKD